MNEIKVRGFIRGQIVDKNGKIVGDTGRIKNTVMNNGFNTLASLAGAVAGSYQVGYAAIGDDGSAAHNATQTDLHSKENEYIAVTPSTSATGTVQFTCSFAGSDNSATLTVNEAGLFKTDSAGSMFCAGTFTGSQMTTDQDFNLSYNLEFAGA